MRSTRAGFNACASPHLARLVGRSGRAHFDALLRSRRTVLGANQMSSSTVGENGQRSTSPIATPSGRSGRAVLRVMPDIREPCSNSLRLARRTDRSGSAVCDALSPFEPCHASDRLARCLTGRALLSLTPCLMPCLTSCCA